MHWQTKDTFYFEINQHKLEAKCWGNSPQRALTFLLLHEGLGSVALWKDFPEQLAQKTQCGVLAYSRFGYGKSSLDTLPRPLDYMTKEAVDILPQVIKQINAKNIILLGHSDGASIASIYAGSFENPAVKALCLFAPHYFTEKFSLESIAQAKEVFENTDMMQKLKKYHNHPSHTFKGWNDAWLDSRFKKWNIEKYISTIQCPILVIQGKQDQYGSIKQIESLTHRLDKQVQSYLLEDCKHSPHLDQTNKVLDIICEYRVNLNL